MKELIFNSIADALDYSKRNYNSLNIIKEVGTNRILGGSGSRKSLFNPVLLVIKDEVKKPEEKVPKHFKGFTKTLTSFDQLSL